MRLLLAHMHMMLDYTAYLGFSSPSGGEAGAVMTHNETAWLGQ